VELRTLRWIAVVTVFPLLGCFLFGSGGGNSSGSQLNVTLTPNWIVALDASQTLSLTASASTFSGATFALEEAS
jgi:hypothetical protein